jgi:hypothetical protein
MQYAYYSMVRFLFWNDDKVLIKNSIPFEEKRLIPFDLIIWTVNFDTFKNPQLIKLV